MKIQTMKAKKRAQIYWLSRAETQDKAITTFLHNDFALQKEQGFFSGDRRIRQGRIGRIAVSADEAAGKFRQSWIGKGVIMVSR